MTKGKWGLWALLILVVAFASVQGWGAQGDFKTLLLGDSPAAVNQKLVALSNAKEVKILAADRFQTQYLNQTVECTLDFFQDKLYDIRVNFGKLPAAAFAGDLKALSDTIALSMEKLYGPPTSDYGYPDQGDVDEYLLPVAEWDIGDKTILSGVLREAGGYRAGFEIYNSKWLAEKEEADAKANAGNG